MIVYTIFGSYAKYKSDCSLYIVYVFLNPISTFYKLEINQGFVLTTKSNELFPTLAEIPNLLAKDYEISVKKPSKLKGLGLTHCLGSLDLSRDLLTCAHAYMLTTVCQKVCVMEILSFCNYFI